MSLLSVQNLAVDFDTRSGRYRAVDNVSFDVGAGQILGIVGESGSGKSVSCLSMMGLLGQTASARGTVEYRGKRSEVGAMEARRKSGEFRAAMIFQDPAAGLNPIRTVGSQIAENIYFSERCSKKAACDQAVALMDSVGIVNPADRAKAYPHQLSGGMNQRVMIAMALACKPEILFADEPTTALDVTVQKQICDLLERLVKEQGLTMIFVSHDLDLVTDLCDKVVVMYAGRVLEQGSSQQIRHAPKHDYTKALFAAIPGHQPAFSELREITPEMAQRFRVSEPA